MRSIDEDTIETTPAQHLLHFEMLLSHSWRGAFPHKPALCAEDARMGNVYSTVACDHFPGDKSLAGSKHSTPIGLEVVAAYSLMGVVCGGVCARARVSGRCVHIPHTSFAAWTSTGGDRVVANADSPITIIVNSFNEDLGTGGIVIAPQQSHLLAFAKDFGEDVVTFVDKKKRVPSSGELAPASDSLRCAVAAFESGMYLLPEDDDDLPKAVSVADIRDDNSIWADKRLRFSPLLPSSERETCLHYVQLAVHSRRIAVSGACLSGEG